MNSSVAQVASSYIVVKLLILLICVIILWGNKVSIPCIHARVGEHFSLADYAKANPSTADAKAIFHLEESKKDPSSSEHIGVARSKDESGIFVHSATARKSDTNFMTHKVETRGSDVHIKGRKLLESENLNADIDNNAKKVPPSQRNDCSHGVSGAFCVGGGR